MTKRLYGAVCKDCNEEYEKYCTIEDFEEALTNTKCSVCGGQLRRSWSFGGYRMRTGATRKPT